MPATDKITTLPEPLTEAGVLAAMRKFDRELRRTAEWANWEAKKNHVYAIRHKDEKYPVMEIVSLATGIPVGRLYGGKDTGHTNTFFEGLPFKIVRLGGSNPDWVRDELILALNLYLKHRPNPPDRGSKEIRELSALLNKLGARLFTPSERSETFRNENGVYMKLMNFRRLDPQYSGGGKKGLSRGSSAEESVWLDFADDPGQCDQVASAIIAALHESPGDQHSRDEEEDDEAPEGRLLGRLHVQRERNKKLVARKKSRVLKETGRLECQVCGFDFALRYGNRGAGFIECHHTTPVATLSSDGRTHLDDLAVVCANCHRMIHRGKPWLSLNELREVMSSRRS